MLFLEKIDLLSIHPFIGKKTDIETIRIKIARDYLIFYEIHEFEIHILSIKDGRQNPRKFKNMF
jgi:toxin YoeB